MQARLSLHCELIYEVHVWPLNNIQTAVDYIAREDTIYIFWGICHARSQKVFSEGLNFFLLLVNQTNKRTYLKSNAETNTTKIGSSSARKRNAMLMAFRWHGPRKFFQMGSSFFYCYCKGTLKQTSLKSGLRRPASETPC